MRTSRAVLFAMLALAGCPATHDFQGASPSPVTGLDAGPCTERGDAGRGPGEGSEPGATHDDAGVARDDAGGANAPPRACARDATCRLQNVFHYERPTYLSDVSLLDVDRDGFLDVLTSYTDSKVMYVQRLRKDGSLSTPDTFETGSVRAHVTGDFDGDGIGDVAVATGHDVVVYRGDGKGKLTKSLSHTFAHDVLRLAAGPLDDDASDDVVVLVASDGTNLGGSLVTLLFRAGGPKETAPITLPKVDSKEPLATSSGKTRAVLGYFEGYKLWLVAADGSLGAEQTPPNFDQAWFATFGNIDGDDYADVVAVLKSSTQDKGQLGVWYGDEHGFTSAPVIAELGEGSSDRMGVPIAVNRAGSTLQDVILHFADGYRLVASYGRDPMQTTLGTFGDFVPWTGKRFLVADMDHTGPLEMLVVDEKSTQLARFEYPMRILHVDEAQGSHLLATDFTRDGLLDLVMTTTSLRGALAIMNNQGASGLDLPRTQSVVGAGLGYRQLGTACDTDGDGHPEIFSVEDGTQIPDLLRTDYATLERGVAVKVPFVGTQYGAVRGMWCFDLDRDGRSDVVEQLDYALGVFHGANLERQAPEIRGVVWSPNPYEEMRMVNHVPIVMVDLDGDGARELLVGRFYGLWWLEEDAGKLAIRGDLLLNYRIGPLLVVDADADGRDDVLVLGTERDDPTSHVFMLRANGKGLDAPKELVLDGGLPAYAWVAADLEGDETPEIAMLGPDSTVRVYRQKGPERYELTQTHAAAPREVWMYAPNAVDFLAADFTGDGQPELALFESDYGTQHVEVLENRTKH